MQKSIDVLQEQLHGISEFGASSSLVETVKVSCYGQKSPLQHIASFETTGRRITVRAFDPSLVEPIAKACREAGFNAHVFSKEAVVVSLPQLSGETREETKSRIKRLGEEAKVSVRNVRKQFKQGIPKDRPKEGLDGIQKATDEAVRIIDGIVARKMSYVDK